MGTLIIFICLLYCLPITFVVRNIIVKFFLYVVRIANEFKLWVANVSDTFVKFSLYFVHVTLLLQWIDNFHHLKIKSNAYPWFLSMSIQSPFQESADVHIFFLLLPLVLRLFWAQLCLLSLSTIWFALFPQAELMIPYSFQLFLWQKKSLGGNFSSLWP